MKKSDGGLRTLFRQKFHSWQWTSIETGISAGGVPDSEFCTPDGVQGWIEFKQTKIFYVNIRPLQVGWLMRRCRYGGNAWIAVRRTHMKDGDQLWLMRGDQAEALCYDGLKGVHALCWEGGPERWYYDEIEGVLRHGAIISTPAESC